MDPNIAQVADSYGCHHLGRGQSLACRRARDFDPNAPVFMNAFTRVDPPIIEGDVVVTRRSGIVGVALAEDSGPKGLLPVAISFSSPQEADQKLRQTIMAEASVGAKGDEALSPVHGGQVHFGHVQVSLHVSSSSSSSSGGEEDEEGDVTHRRKSKRGKDGRRNGPMSATCTWVAEQEAQIAMRAKQEKVAHGSLCALDADRKGGYESVGTGVAMHYAGHRVEIADRAMRVGTTVILKDDAVKAWKKEGLQRGQMIQYTGADMRDWRVAQGAKMIEGYEKEVANETARLKKWSKWNHAALSDDDANTGADGSPSELDSTKAAASAVAKRSGSDMRSASSRDGGEGAQAASSTQTNLPDALKAIAEKPVLSAADVESLERVAIEAARCMKEKDRGDGTTQLGALDEGLQLENMQGWNGTNVRKGRIVSSSGWFRMVPSTMTRFCDVQNASAVMKIHNVCVPIREVRRVARIGHSPSYVLHKEYGWVGTVRATAGLVLIQDIASHACFLVRPNVLAMDNDRMSSMMSSSVVTVPGTLVRLLDPRFATYAGTISPRELNNVSSGRAILEMLQDNLRVGVGVEEQVAPVPERVRKVIHRQKAVVVPARVRSISRSNVAKSGSDTGESEFDSDFDSLSSSLYDSYDDDEDDIDEEDEEEEDDEFSDASFSRKSRSGTTARGGRDKLSIATGRSGRRSRKSDQKVTFEWEEKVVMDVRLKPKLTAKVPKRHGRFMTLAYTEHIAYVDWVAAVASGVEVEVKVQRPALEELIDMDAVTKRKQIREAERERRLKEYRARRELEREAKKEEEESGSDTSSKLTADASGSGSSSSDDDDDDDDDEDEEGYDDDSKDGEGKGAKARKKKKRKKKKGKKNEKRRGAGSSSDTDSSDKVWSDLLSTDDEIDSARNRCMPIAARVPSNFVLEKDLVALDALPTDCTFPDGVVHTPVDVNIDESSSDSGVESVHGGSERELVELGTQFLKEANRKKAHKNEATDDSAKAARKEKREKKEKKENGDGEDEDESETKSSSDSEWAPIDDEGRPGTAGSIGLLIHEVMTPEQQGILKRLERVDKVRKRRWVRRDAEIQRGHATITSVQYVFPSLTVDNESSTSDEATARNSVGSSTESDDDDESDILGTVSSPGYSAFDKSRVVPFGKSANALPQDGSTLSKTGGMSMLRKLGNSSVVLMDVGDDNMGENGTGDNQHENVVNAADEVVLRDYDNPRIAPRELKRLYGTDIFDTDTFIGLPPRYFCSLYAACSMYGANLNAMGPASCDMMAVRNSLDLARCAALCRSVKRGEERTTLDKTSGSIRTRIDSITDVGTRTLSRGLSRGRSMPAVGGSTVDCGPWRRRTKFAAHWEPCLFLAPATGSPCRDARTHQSAVDTDTDAPGHSAPTRNAIKMAATQRATEEAAAGGGWGRADVMERQREKMEQGLNAIRDQTCSVWGKHPSIKKTAFCLPDDGGNASSRRGSAALARRADEKMRNLRSLMHPYTGLPMGISRDALLSGRASGTARPGAGDEAGSRDEQVTPYTAYHRDAAQGPVSHEVPAVQDPLWARGYPVLPVQRWGRALLCVCHAYS